MTSHRTSETAIGRSLGFERGVVVVIGLVALLAGVAALVVGAGWFGRFRAEREVLDPLVVQWFSDSPSIALPVLIVLGLVLLVLGIWWLTRALRPEPRPDLRLETAATGMVTVTSAALSDAVRCDAEAVTGVQRARVRMAGSEHRPALRLTLSLQEGTNVRHVWEELDTKVLSRVRQALDSENVPASIRLQLNRAPRQRVH